MRSRTGLLACGLVVLGLLLSSGAALADGGGGSAGNSQYVDPLGGQTHPGHGKSHNSSSGTSTTSATTATSTTSTSPTLSQSAPSSVASSGTSSTSSNGSGKTLPFTGLNLWACIGLGLGMLGAGLGLRRVLARVY